MSRRGFSLLSFSLTKILELDGEKISFDKDTAKTKEN